MVELPKGTYQLHFHRRTAEETKPPAEFQGARYPERVVKKIRNWEIAVATLEIYCWQPL